MIEALCTIEHLNLIAVRCYIIDKIHRKMRCRVGMRYGHGNIGQPLSLNSKSANVEKHARWLNFLVSVPKNKCAVVMIHEALS